MNKISGAAAISVSGLNKSYGKFKVIRDLDLEIQNGAIHGLVGLNGSGKTTTLECILGLQPLNSGTISVLGRNPRFLHKSQGRAVAILNNYWALSNSKISKLGTCRSVTSVVHQLPRLFLGNRN